MEPVETINCAEAGRLVHRNAERIRAGLRQNKFDFGTAIPPKKEGGRWNYIIIKSKFYKWAEIELKEVI